MRLYLTFFIVFSLIQLIICDEDDVPSSLPPHILKIIEQVEDLLPESDPPEELKPEDLHSEYDFIVIGSGPGGSVIANRLTENPATTVLLLEAGGRPSTIHTIPALAQYSDTPETSWNYEINPNPGSCLGFQRQRCIYPLGKVLGGSSAVNYAMYVRGSRFDYDTWEKMGNYGWGYESLLPYFERYENATAVKTGDGEHRGHSGPLTISHAPFRSTIVEQYIKANEELGVEKLDYNGPRSKGTDYFQGTTRNGRRMSAKEAYLDPVVDRKNLHIMINSLVSRIVINPVTRTAQGIDFLYEGETFRILSKKEVILSAGPFNSPQLLMLSGIGPKEDLIKLNISVLADLPVGQNYLDHTISPEVVVLVNTTGQNVNLMDISEEDVQQFALEGRGKLTTPASGEALTLIHNGVGNIPTEFPNMELILYAGKNEAGSPGYSVLRDINYEAVYAPIEDPSIEVYSMGALDQYAVARGTVRLRGNSILNPPIIDFPFFNNPHDIDAMIAGIRSILAIAETESMKRLNATVHTIPWPECAEHGFGTDPYFICLVRQSARNLCHIASTVKMGPKNDPGAVVDAELRVYGIRKLRVADSSIAPTQIAGHTQAVAYVVGEKMADILKADWNL